MYKAVTATHITLILLEDGGMMTNGAGSSLLSIVSIGDSTSKKKLFSL